MRMQLLVVVIARSRSRAYFGDKSRMPFGSLTENKRGGPPGKQRRAEKGEQSGDIAISTQRAWLHNEHKLSTTCVMA